MKTLRCFCTVAIFFTLSYLRSQTTNSWSGFPEARVTVRVIGEDGTPISGVRASFVFGGKYDYGQTLVKVVGETDERGLFTAQGYTYGTSFGPNLEKPGYYLGGAPIPIFRDSSKGQWQPWNETYTTILRPIGKPTALYAKRVDVEIPELDKPCGFDLEAGDWVAPYGKGVVEDFIFTLRQERHSVHDYDVVGELAFKNPEDGLQYAPMSTVGTNSIFKWNRDAPDTGYHPTLQLQNSWHGGKSLVQSFKNTDKVWVSYFFRVRTTEHEGEIVSTHYGKIRGDIEVFPHDAKPKIVFTYYFNPIASDPNLEWDIRKNLFQDLGLLESPHDP